jgi:hypothetical protein
MRHFLGRIRRLVLAFSKSPEHHKAAVALCYCYYKLCWIPRTMRVTPAMAIGVTSHPWDLTEFRDALLTAKPCEAPAKQPIALWPPATTARPLPNGRGFLRVVLGPGGSPSSPAPAPTPATAAPVAPSADPSGQLDLLAWRPRPEAPVAPSKRLPPPGQLDLFGLDFDPEPSKP